MCKPRDIAAVIVVLAPLAVAISHLFDHGMSRPIQRAAQMGNLFSLKHESLLLFAVIATLAAGGVAALVAAFNFGKKPDDTR